MRITVEKKGYTYETGRFTVKVGDTVILPTASWLLDVLPPTWTSTVTSLTSAYDGPCEAIVGVKRVRLKKS